MIEWISVKDRLPTDNGKYLFLDDDSCFLDEYEARSAFLKNKQEYLDYKGTYITHWAVINLPEGIEK
jgi:hypothetical protein